MMPGPGTRCALVRSAQSAILYRPPPYCATTVLPMSANLRSSKIMKSAARAHRTAPARQRAAWRPGTGDRARHPRRAVTVTGMASGRQQLVGQHACQGVF